MSPGENNMCEPSTLYNARSILILKVYLEKKNLPSPSVEPSSDYHLRFLEKSLILFPFNVRDW